jgi:hypothetical protein
MVSVMISAELRRNTVAQVRRLAHSLTAAERLVAACEWIGWQEFLNEWAGALSASNKDWFRDCFSSEAGNLLRTLDAVLTGATSRHRRESAEQFAASTRFTTVASSAAAFVRALDAVEHPRPLDD